MAMTANTMADAAPQTTTQWEESLPSAEQLALTEFAARLGSHIRAKPDKDDENVREEAELLLSLLSSKPPSQSTTRPNLSFEAEDAFGGNKFSLACPLLSLDTDDAVSRDSTRKNSDTSNESCPSLASTSSSPATLLARRLVMDDRDALSISADTMARNILQSFHEAVQWRLETWIHSLSHALVSKEKDLKESHDAKEQDLRALLETPEAKVLLCLRKAALDIQVVDTTTSFKVLSQRIRTSTPPLKKKRKLEKEPAACLHTETEYKYTVAHALTFEAVMNLSTPAGYTEVTIEAPGTIEGTFFTSDVYGEILTGVSVEINTRVVAAAMERSSRIVARAATHAVIPQEEEDKATTTKDDQVTTPVMSSPIPQTKPSFDNNATAALVTPRNNNSSPSYLDDTTDTEVSSIPIPNDLDDNHNDVIRMVSPQPRSPSFTFTPRTPTSKLNPPPLVSPPPTKKETLDDDEDDASRTSPSLPLLVQVACAAMYAN